MMSQDRPKLACKQKAGHLGRWWIVGLEQSCANFYPSSTFLASRRSFNEDGKAGSATVRRIPLTRGKFALVDAEDYYRLAQYQWFAVLSDNTFYAVRKNKGKNVKIHRVVMGAPDHLVVDHIDHNGLNNCKSNLRLCTTAQNNRNMRSVKGASSRYKGVGWNKRMKRWRALIQCDQKPYFLGDHENETDAARAYDKKAKELHGEFACLNFPPNQQRGGASRPNKSKKLDPNFQAPTVREGTKTEAPVAPKFQRRREGFFTTEGIN